MKKIFISGITGQDGSYLAKLFLEQGNVEVFGGVRRVSVRNTGRLEFLGILDKVKLFPFELAEYENMRETLEQIRPDYIFHMGAQTFVTVSFNQPLYTSEITAMGALRLLEAIRHTKLNSKNYFAGSSEQFGDVLQTPQNEQTPFNPRSPYAVAKVFGFQMWQNYRVAYKMFNVGGLLFNHEGPLRGEEFITRKITYAVAEIYAGRTIPLRVGNLNAKRDWGDSEDYMKAVMKMMEYPTPEDFVIAMGETHTVREFCDLAFQAIGKKLVWEGEGIQEKGLESVTKQCLVEVGSEFFRPSEVNLLMGDASKAKKLLSWTPLVDFASLVENMVHSDMQLIIKGRAYGH